MLPSKNKLHLKKLLLEQHHLDADLYSFRRTYAGRLLKSDGAFSWTMLVKDIDTNHSFEVGSCYPLSSFNKKDTVIEINTSWRDYELIPYTKEEWIHMEELIRKNGEENSEVY